MRSSFKTIRFIYVTGIIVATISFITSLILMLIYFLNPEKVPYGPQSWEYNFVYNKKILAAFITLFVISCVLFIILGLTNKSYKIHRSINDEEFVKQQISQLQHELKKINISLKTSKKATNIKSELLARKSQINEMIRYYKNDYINDVNNRRAKRNSVILASLAIAGATASAAGSSISSGYEKGWKIRSKQASPKFYKDGVLVSKEFRKNGTIRTKGMGKWGKRKFS